MQNAQNNPLNILIADSDEATGMALRTKLQAMGHNALWVKNGIIAIQTGLSFAPDLVVIDLHIENVRAPVVCTTLQDEHDLSNTVFVGQGKTLTAEEREELSRAARISDVLRQDQEVRK